MQQISHNLCKQQDAYVIGRKYYGRSLYSYEQFNMKLRGSIVCCLVMEFCSFNQKEYLLAPEDSMSRISIITVFGLLFQLM